MDKETLKTDDLAELLPFRIMNNRKYYSLTIRKHSHGWEVGYATASDISGLDLLNDDTIFSPKLADALAKMFIYLKENKLYENEKNISNID
jgi:hypothetical protein